ncbi:hypothetical protein ES705_13154 [subsurface metagenome]|nr:hypothetical protein [Methanosarcinales archaeon]
MSEVAMPEILESLAKIGEQWELGESVWRVWGCMLFKSCPVSQREIEKGTGYSSGLITINLEKLKMTNLIKEIKMGGEMRYSVNTSLTGAFGMFSKRFFEDNLKPVITLLSENLDKIEDARVKNTFLELINECKKVSLVALILPGIIEDINTSAINVGENLEEAG